MKWAFPLTATRRGTNSRSESTEQSSLTFTSWTHWVRHGPAPQFVWLTDAHSASCVGEHLRNSPQLPLFSSTGWVKTSIQCEQGQVVTPFAKESSTARLPALDKRWRSSGPFPLRTWGYFNNGLWHLQFDRKTTCFLMLHKAEDAVAILDE